MHEAVPTFDAPESQCLEDNAFDFVALGGMFPNATYSWIFENATPGSSVGTAVGGVEFLAGGWQEVLLTLNEIGCTGTHLDSVFIETPPNLSAFNIEANPPSGCAPLTVLLSSDANSEEVAQSWTFSDGETSEAFAPVHVFEEPGVYDVSVFAMSTGNCPAFVSFGATALVEAYPDPPVGFEVAPLVVELTNPVVDLESLVDPVNDVSYFMSDGGGLNALTERMPSRMAALSKSSKPWSARRLYRHLRP